MADNNQHIAETGKTDERTVVRSSPPVDGNPIELRNEEIEAILGRAPDRLVRNGIMVIFGAMLLVFAGTIFFSYPDVINCRVVITSSNPPVHLLAQTSGRIHQLPVTDHQQVKAGQLLAVLDNPASTEDLLALESLVDSLKMSGGIMNDEYPAQFPFTKLGDVTPYYLEFQKATAEYVSFEELRYHPQKIEAIGQQIELTMAYRERMKEQLELMEQDMAVEQRNYERDSTLFRIKAILPLEMDQSKSRWIQKKHALVGAKISLEDVQMQLNQLHVTQLDLQTEYSKQRRQLIDNVSRALDALHNQLDFWKKNYTFRSPNDGIVSFARVWAPNQFITAGEPVMSILPLHEEKIIGKMDIPIAGSGKIKPGQKVIIKLDGYPYMEFGTVKGIIKSISLVPVKDVYIAEVMLPDGLRSNYGDSIPFSQEMAGTADIVIEDMSLFERFLQPVRSAIKRK